MKRLTFFLIIILLSTIPSLHAWDDTALLHAGGNTIWLKPNIMILFDNSGSMNNIIRPPFFTSSSRTDGPSCDNIDPAYEYSPTIPSNVWYLANYTLTQVSGYVYRLNVPDCDGAGGYTPRPIYVYVERYHGQWIRIPGALLNFLVYHATAEQIEMWNNFQRYGVWKTNANLTAADTSDSRNYKKVRIRVAAKVMQEIIWDIYTDWENEPVGAARPRIGLAEFDGGSDPHGVGSFNPCQNNTDKNSYITRIGNIVADTWTPLSEAYVEMWAYFRVGGDCDIGTDKYFRPLNHPQVQNISSNCPVTNWCQLNFMIVVTDGEPTQDTELRELGSDTLFYTPSNTAPWGEDANLTENDNDTATLASNGTNYLDDLAAFAFREDIFPDEYLLTDNDYEKKYKHKQFIYTYAIGFNIDNQLLRDTAENGGGEYFVADDYDSLLQAMRDVFASIDEKVRAFASFAAPKYSLTYGERYGYSSTFVPKRNYNIWEGHLRCYVLDADGEFPSDLENPPAGRLRWDAGALLHQRASSDRDIWTAIGGTDEDFTTGNTDITFGLLNVVDDTEKDAVINYIRGDNGFDVDGSTWKLGDIFHFTPVVVGAPLRWKGAFDPSYEDFFDYYTDEVTDANGDVIGYTSRREEVVYAGANDGMLHCFRISDGAELWAFIPPSMLPKLKHSVPGVTGSLNQHNYFVDGKGMARDIKVRNISGGYYGDYRDWRTIIIFGMGIGGKTYCALDITDPASPVFLYEFSDVTYMAYTEGKPIITSVANDGSGNMESVVFLSGGYDDQERPASVNRSGKSFYILNAYTGAVIKEFLYDTSLDDSVSGNRYTHTNPGFHYAFAATPTVLGTTLLGSASCVYMCESGDAGGANGEGARIWKVPLTGDPLTWIPQKIFQAPNGQTIYVPPTLGYTDQYKLWLLFGTGHRAVPNDEDNITGQFYGFADDGTITSASPITTSNLINISAAFQTTGTDTDFKLNDNATGNLKGFYFNFLKNQEILFEPNPIYISNTIYFNTYAPIQAGDIIDPCAPQGNQYVYNFGFSGSMTEINIEDTTVTQAKIRGYGLFSGGKFKMYFGDGEVGSPFPPTNPPPPPPDPEGIFGRMLWKEVKR